MPTFPQTLCAALLLAACCSLPLRAQDDDRWYQVELIIFSNEDTTTNEQWEATPSLAYPGAARFLVYPELVAARQEEHGGLSEMDEFGRQFLRPAVDEEDSNPLQGTDIPLRGSRAATVPDAPATVDPNTPAAADPAPGTDAATPRPTPFIALPHTAREFHGKSAYMQRTGLYRTLFHETWVQPVPDERLALPLIIDNSGDAGTWTRLQGSIKLHLSRYLHIETNLWLNTRGRYLSGGWRMPPPPLGPPSVIVEAPEPEIEFGDWEEAGEPVQNAVTAEEQLPPDPNGIAPEDIEPIYPYRHAVLLRQKRRMRSNELHYIDHPLLGVVIKLTPLDDEQLAEMAAAEQADSQVIQPP